MSKTTSEFVIIPVTWQPHSDLLAVSKISPVVCYLCFIAGHLAPRERFHKVSPVLKIRDWGKKKEPIRHISYNDHQL